MWSMKTGRLPSIERTFVHTRPASLAFGSSNRSASRGCSLDTWMQTFRITSACWLTRRAPSPARWSHRRRGTARSAAVEVDDEPNPAAGDPHADPDLPERRVHQVAVVAAVVRAFALEEQVAAQHGAVRVAGPAADVLGPVVPAEARRAKPVPGVAADEVVALAAGGEESRVWPRHVRRDGCVHAQRGDVPAARRRARSARRHPAAG